MSKFIIKSGIKHESCLKTKFSFISSIPPLQSTKINPSHTILIILNNFVRLLIPEFETQSRFPILRATQQLYMLHDANQYHRLRFPRSATLADYSRTIPLS
jgi:hypothetical protein